MPEVHQAQSSAVLQHCPAVLHRREIPSSAPQDHWWTAAIPPKLSRHDPPVRFRKLLDRSPTWRTHDRPVKNLSNYYRGDECRGTGERDGDKCPLLGGKAASEFQGQDVHFWPIADIPGCSAHVCL